MMTVEYSMWSNLICPLRKCRWLADHDGESDDSWIILDDQAETLYLKARW
jgi:hypothetical protein